MKVIFNVDDVNTVLELLENVDVKGYKNITNLSNAIYILSHKYEQSNKKEQEQKQ